MLILGDFFFTFIANILAKKLPGQVRLGHQRRFVDPTSEKFAIPPKVDFFRGSIFSLQVFIRVPPYTIFISQNLYICGLSSGQIRDLYITGLWENV